MTQKQRHERSRERMAAFHDIHAAYAMAQKQLGKNASVIAMLYAMNVYPKE